VEDTHITNKHCLQVINSLRITSQKKSQDMVCDRMASREKFMKRQMSYVNANDISAKIEGTSTTLIQQDINQKLEISLYNNQAL